ncbi:hypothetical protein [Desulfatitalea tepidiphila]|uniref:hypothetical protein n=1 Tax=Desulfatitalea tepidiphila TaxID=1185843 RepID=UPI0006B503DF|nr:hypothetical protein [Desulfatitalea tepidiphila]
MRTVNIGGKDFKIRALKRRERIEHGLAEYGYKAMVYQPPKSEDGAIDFEKASEGMDKVTLLVLGDEAVDAIDEAEGMGGLRKAYKAIIDETYGSGAEEKN